MKVADSLMTLVWRIQSQENLLAVTRTIEKNRPTGCKGKLWITATLSSTMGPGIKVDVNLLKAASA